MKMKILGLSLMLLLGASSAWGATYYTATTGNDSNTCEQAQSTSTPKLTIAAGLTCMTAGDTLYIRAGLYAEVIRTNTQFVPTGTSWANPVTIAAYPGETVTLKPNSGHAVVYILESAHKYIVFDRLILDGDNVQAYVVSLDGVNETGSGFIRFTNCEMKNSNSSGIITGRQSDHNEFINNVVHHNGVAPITKNCCGYGFYIQSDDNLIEGNTITDHTGYGIHVYSGFSDGAHRNIIRRNLVHGNATHVLAIASAGILIGSGDGNRAEYNIVYNQPYGIVVGHNAATNSQVYNNTVYNNSKDGIHIRSSSKSTLIQNNIVYNNGQHNINNRARSGTTLVTNRTTAPSLPIR